MSHRRRFTRTKRLRCSNARLAAGADEPFTRYYIADAVRAARRRGKAREHLERPLEELPAFTRWRLPRDPDFDPVRERLSI